MLLALGSRSECYAAQIEHEKEMEESETEAEDDVAEEEDKAEENKVELDAPTEDRNLGV